MKKITNGWFYSQAPWWLMLLGIYVKGDAIALLPVWIFFAIIAYFSSLVALKVIIIFFFIRAIGEMIYWFLQQFGDKSYRPYDFGLRDLNTNAIYIIYQTLELAVAIAWVFIWLIATR